MKYKKLILFRVDKYSVWEIPFISSFSCKNIQQWSYCKNHSKRKIYIFSFQTTFFFHYASNFWILLHSTRVYIFDINLFKTVLTELDWILIYGAILRRFYIIPWKSWLFRSKAWYCLYICMFQSAETKTLKMLDTK